MSDNPAIPFGYRRIQGQLQKGDGLWNGTRFARVKKGYPFVGTQELIAIRRCAVEQTELLPAEASVIEVMELE